MTEMIQESPIATKPTKPAKQKKLWIGIIGGIVALLVLVVGFQSYKKYSFKSVLRPYVLKDNILTEDILELHSSDKATIGDIIDKGKKNIEARELIIQDIRMVDPGSYKSELDMYVEILKVENEYVQSVVANYEAYLKKRVAEAEKENWGQNLCNRYPMEPGCTRVKRDVEAATKRWYEKIREDRETTEKWLAKEKDYHKLLSAFLPARNLIPKLEEMVKSKQSNAQNTAVSKEMVKSSAQNTAVSKWWLVSKKADCIAPAEAGYTPDDIMKSYPECKITHNDNELLTLDCSQSELKTWFIYRGSKEGCLESRERLNKER